MPHEDPITPIDPVANSDPNRNARDFILRPLRPLARYLRYQMIMRRRKLRKERRIKEGNQSNRPPDSHGDGPSSGFDVEA